jgi:dUTPase
MTNTENSVLFNSVRFYPIGHNDDPSFRPWKIKKTFDGFELLAHEKESVVILPKSWAVVRTGWKVVIPADQVGEIRRGSSLPKTCFPLLLNDGHFDGARKLNDIPFLNAGDHPHEVEAGAVLVRLCVHDRAALLDDTHLRLDGFVDYETLLKLKTEEGWTR